MVEYWNNGLAPPGKITNYKIQITNKEVPFGQINTRGEGPGMASFITWGRKNERWGLVIDFLDRQ